MKAVLESKQGVARGQPEALRRVQRVLRLFPVFPLPLMTLTERFLPLLLLHLLLLLLLQSLLHPLRLPLLVR